MLRAIYRLITDRFHKKSIETTSLSFFPTQCGSRTRDSIEPSIRKMIQIKKLPLTDIES